MKKMVRTLLSCLSVLAVFGLATPPVFASEEAEDATPASTQATTVRLVTSMGSIVLELYPEEAPITVENFLQYVGDGFFDGTIFHRVIPGFMIQGGGHTADMTEKATRETIRNEATNGLKNERGTIAMGRRPGPHTAAAQFYLNLVDNGGLDHRNQSQAGYGYCVFGRVIEGMDVVDAIAEVPTTTRGIHANVPIEPVLIERAEVVGDSAK